MMRQSLATVRSLKWVDYVYFALLEPRRLVTRISDEASKPYWGALLVVFFASFAEILAASLVTVNTHFFYHKITYGLLLVFLINLMKIAVVALLIDALCQCMGFDGMVKTIFAVAGYAFFPQMFVLPLVYIVKVFSFAPVFFLSVFSIVLGIWSAIIVIVGVSEIHSMQFSKAALVFLFPYAAVGLYAFLVVVLVVMNLLGYVAAI